MYKWLLYFYRATEFYCVSNKSCIDSILICDGKRDCPSGEDEDICQPYTSCPKHAFRCGAIGNCIDQKALCDNFNDCVNGDDETDLLCKSLATNSSSSSSSSSSTLNCSPIKSHRLIATCTFNGQVISCRDGDKLQPGTIAIFSCKKFYEPHKNLQHTEAICQKNGKWSSEILKCNEKCGYLKENSNAAIPLIVNGYPMDKLYPWHATMFIKRENQYEFACGATLISDSVVISASHCFTGLNESDVKFAIGKRYSNITIHSNDEPNAKILDVKRIYRHPMYLDNLGNYGQDIALVELNEIIELNDDIYPICIDWDGIDSVVENQLGILVGMGVTENETFSDVIRMTRLNVISTENCIKKQPKDFQKFITFTTFCAGLDNGKCEINF